MPIVFVCSGVLNLLLLFDKLNLKNKYKKILYMVFLFLIQISYFSSYVKFDDIYFNFLQCVLFVIMLLFSLYRAKLNFKILIISIFTACIYDYVLNNFFDNVIVYSFSNVCFLLALIIPIFIYDFYKSLSLLFLNLLFLIVLNVNFEMSKYTFSIVDFDFCFQIILIFLIFKFLNYLFALYFFNSSKYKRSYKNEKNCFEFYNNLFYRFNID